MNLLALEPADSSMDVCAHTHTQTQYSFSKHIITISTHCLFKTCYCWRDTAKMLKNVVSAEGWSGVTQFPAGFIIIDKTYTKEDCDKPHKGNWLFKKGKGKGAMGARVKEKTKILNLNMACRFILISQMEKRKRKQNKTKKNNWDKC